MAVYPNDNNPYNQYYRVSGDGNQWISNTQLSGNIEKDCNGDGLVNPEASKACMGSNDWYAKTGIVGCPNPITQEVGCSAPAPTQKNPLAEWTLPGWDTAKEMVLMNNHVYVLGNYTLYTVNMNDTTSGIETTDIDPIETLLYGYYTVSDNAYTLSIHNGYLYVGAYRGTHVFDLSDPSNPTKVAFLESNGAVEGLAFYGHVLYLADGGGMTVVDITVPETPTTVTRFNIGVQMRGIGINRRDGVLLLLTDNGEFPVSVHEIV